MYSQLHHFKVAGKNTNFKVLVFFFFFWPVKTFKLYVSTSESFEVRS